MRTVPLLLALVVSGCSFDPPFEDPPFFEDECDFEPCACGPCGGAFGQIDAVDVGDAHACAIRNGFIDCWGDLDGRSGWNWPFDQGFVTIAAGRDHTCALADDGTAECWSDQGGAVTSPPAEVFRQMDSGGDAGCGIRSEDARRSCWGTLAIPPEGGYAQVADGDGHACALGFDRRAHCWGDDERGQSTAPDEPLVAVTAGDGFSCGLRDGDAALLCWGDAPLSDAAGPYSFFDAGGSRICALLTGGNVECWSPNNWLALITPNGTVQSMAVGDFDACFVLTGGGLECESGGFFP
jgi:hypothetical protein